ncbi:replication protein RepA [Xanthomonas phaseoli]|uniref:replication protein RepA n=1 Tax=Xanthomonas phaseoli TaxID=1985254 RepID=UPI0002EE8547|nr:replication protein RepA [Xanthomonas phaseoli]
MELPFGGAESEKRDRAKINEDKFIAECMAIEAESAREAGALGYMARVLVQATMPHSRKEGTNFKRTNGTLTVEIVSSSKGLPYGSYPRLLLAWLTTEAVRTQERTLYLGDSLSQFMGKLDLLPTGGRWGTIPRLREQAMRLFHSFVTAYDSHGERGRGGERGRNIMVADDWDLWWDPREAEQQGALFTSWVKLTDRFYDQVTDRPVPIDLRAIKVLKKSPMALDLYSWSTYRMSYLSHRTEIPWGALQMQLGADYADDPKGQRNFKLKLLAALRKVVTVYPQLRATEGERGLVLMPSPPHVKRLK